MQNTTHYNLKKPDYTDFADVFDINDNMDTIDEKLAAPDGDGRDQTVSFTDADLDSGITSFPNFLTKIVSGMKMAKFLRDFKAGMAYVLHVGNLVNNATCTESGKALDARMGKTLQDQITSLNDSFQYKKAVPFDVSACFQSSSSTSIRRRGNAASFSLGESSKAIAASASPITLGTLPEEFRPYGNIYTNGVDATNEYVIGIYILTSGVVQLYNYNKNIPYGSQYRFNITYFVP